MIATGGGPYIICATLIYHIVQKLAIKDFLKKKRNYKKIVIDKIRQPDVILEKIKT